MKNEIQQKCAGIFFYVRRRPICVTTEIKSLIQYVIDTRTISKNFSECFVSILKKQFMVDKTIYGMVKTLIHGKQFMVKNNLWYGPD